MNKLDQYLDAARALRALEAAQKDEGKTDSRSAAIKFAKDDVKILASKLSSREHWLAQRELAKRD